MHHTAAAHVTAAYSPLRATGFAAIGKPSTRSPDPGSDAAPGAVAAAMTGVLRARCVRASSPTALSAALVPLTAPPSETMCKRGERISGRSISPVRHRRLFNKDNMVVEDADKGGSPLTDTIRVIESSHERQVVAEAACRQRSIASAVGCILSNVQHVRKPVKALPS